MASRLNLIPIFTLLLLASCKPQKDIILTPPPKDFNFLKFDESKKELEKSKALKHGEKLKLEITNINKNLWTILDSSTQQSFNTDIPDIFKGIKLPSYLNLELPAPAQQDGAMSPGGGAMKLDDIKLYLKTIADAQAKMTDAIELNNTYKELYMDCAQEFDDIEKILIDKTKTFLPGGENSRKTQPSALEKLLKKQVTESREALKKLKGGLPLYTEQQYNKIAASMKGPIWEFKNTALPKTDARYISLGKAAQQAESDNETIKRHIESLNEALKNAETVVAELEKFLSDGKIAEFVSNYNLINKSNFTYYTEELKVKEDLVNLNLTFTATKPLACNIPAKQNLDIKLSTYGGVKIDFSTGIFVMFGNQDFLGRDLYYKPVDSATVSIAAKDGGKRALLGIGALMHIYWRTGRKINYAISPGLSTTTGFDVANFHLGGSLLTGGKNRLAITAGLTLKESKILDKQYQLGTSESKATLPEDPPSIKVFPKAGWFVSLTYNWSKLK